MKTHHRTMCRGVRSPVRLLDGIDLYLGWEGGLIEFSSFIPRLVAGTGSRFLRFRPTVRSRQVMCLGRQLNQEIVWFHCHRRLLLGKDQSN